MKGKERLPSEHLFVFEQLMISGISKRYYFETATLEPFNFPSHPVYPGWPTEIR